MRKFPIYQENKIIIYDPERILSTVNLIFTEIVWLKQEFLHMQVTNKGKSIEDIKKSYNNFLFWSCVLAVFQ